MTPDLTGRVFGRMTVIEAAGEGLPAVSGGWWLARCVCSREVVCVAEALLAGRVASCGRRTPEQREQLAEQLAAYNPPPQW